MFKHILAGCLLLLTTTAFSQTLFTYGTDSVSVPVFLQAYHKNNTGAKNAKAMRSYLDLYIASRLKIKEAKARGYDTLPQITSDLASLRSQIMPTYMTDAASVDKLVQEAFQRSQKDIHAAHIFIPLGTNGDTAAAWKKANEAWSDLQRNIDFATVARKYSADPSVQVNGGDMGYITVFSLPYEFENIIYATRPGQLAPIYRSSGGYHIFKNLDERKALGRVKAAQILLAFPPESDAATKASMGRLADSLYTRLVQGDAFGKLAQQFSLDVTSAGADGQMPEFSVGQYDALFERNIFALKDGAISRPFATDYGYHIVKRIGTVPVPAMADEKTLQQLRERVTQNDRIHSITDRLLQQLVQEHYRPASFSQQQLTAYTDSLLDDKKSGLPLQLKPQDPLFSMAGKTITVSDWISYAQANRMKHDGSGLKPHTVLWNDFVAATALEHYQQNMETYNPAFRQQVEEFRDGNLFFEIMQQEVWNRSQTDSAAVAAFYNANKAKYKWNKSADAVVFYVSDLATANSFRQQVVRAPRNWKNFVAALNEKVAADSNRFEITQLPNASKQPLKAGTITTPVVNNPDNTVSFAYILKMYPQPQQRTFAEARGLVVNDYQAALEKKWVEELKGKYPVVINQKELAKLMGK